MADAVHYHEYLQLDKILNAQWLESAKHHISAPDEMLFIGIHQAYAEKENIHYFNTVFTSASEAVRGKII